MPQVKLELLYKMSQDICKGDILFFFDDDILLEPDYIEQTMKCFNGIFSSSWRVLGTFTSPIRHRKRRNSMQNF